MHHLPRVYLELELSLNEDLSGQHKVFNCHGKIWKTLVPYYPGFFASEAQRALEKMRSKVEDFLVVTKALIMCPK